MKSSCVWAQKRTQQREAKLNSPEVWDVHFGYFIICVYGCSSTFVNAFDAFNAFRFGLALLGPSPFLQPMCLWFWLFRFRYIYPIISCNFNILSTIFWHFFWAHHWLNSAKRIVYIQRSLNDLKDINSKQKGFPLSIIFRRQNKKAFKKESNRFQLTWIVYIYLVEVEPNGFVLVRKN